LYLQCITHCLLPVGKIASVCILEHSCLRWIFSAVWKPSSPGGL
jgi:hypothetical protein